MQLDAGAVGLTVAKLGEAEVFIESGVPDVLIAYPLWGETKWRRLCDLAERARRAGFELAVAHDLFVHHFGSRTNTVRPEFCCSEFVIAIIEHVCCRHGQQMGALRGRPIG